MRRALVPMLLCLTVACSESFLPPSAVTNLRVIGARIDIEGAPNRANPSPGDEVVASILVTDRGADPAPDQEEPPLTPPELTWAFFACVPTATRIGVPICGAEIGSCEGCVGPPPDDPLALPVIRFQVPSEEKLDAVEAREVLLLGVVCGEGSPSAEAIARLISGETDDLVPCEGPGIPEEPPSEGDERNIVGRIVTVQIPIERIAEDPNLNPGIANVRLNGSDWPPPYDEEVPRTAPRTGCKDDLVGLTPEEPPDPPIAGDEPWNIRLSVTEGSLQSFTVDDVEMKEEIQVSWLADSGAFEVAFSFITEPPSPGAVPSILTQWKPPSNAPAVGRLVRFNFVIRDGRGGLHRVERGLCVLKEPLAESPP